MYWKKIVAVVLAEILAAPVCSGIGTWETKTAQAAVSSEEITIEKDVAGNPLVNKGEDGNIIYGGDPSILVDGDTVYLYIGHDAATDSEVSRKIYNMKDYLCYSTKDMKTWKAEGSVFRGTDISWASNTSSCWAAQAAKHNGKYYLYYCTWDKTAQGKQSIGVAVSDSATGPFTDIGESLVKGTVTMPQSNNWDDIDPTVWIETDEKGEEHRYLAWGNSRYYICELNDDMISVKDQNGDGKITCGTSVKNADIINKTPAGYTEAPWIYRRQDENGNYTGPYYLFYASGWHEKMAYSTTDDLMSGEWTYGSVVMDPTATSNTNHMAVFDFQGKTYFLHHNGSQPAGNGYRRIPCVVELTWNEDGSVQKMEESASGVSGTTSVLYTNSGQLLEHEYFVNSSSESNYPYTYKMAGTGIGKLDTDHEWLLVPGKADTSKETYVSIQSENKPGLYLTAQSKSKVRLAQDTDNTAKTAKSQTFITKKGLSSEQGISFESVTYPGYYLTMVNGTLSLSDGTDKEAATFYRSVDVQDGSLRSIAASISKNEVLAGDKNAQTFVKNSIKVTAAYANGTSKKVTDFTVHVDTSKAGTKNASVTYTEGSVTKTTYATVKVIAKPEKSSKLTVSAALNKNKKKTVVKLNWKKTAGSRYELSYGKTKNKHTVLGTVKNTETTKTSRVSSKKLVKGKKYYFSVRSYVTVNGKKVYGAYRTVSAKIKG